MKSKKSKKISIVAYVIFLLMLVIVFQSAFSLNTIIWTDITTRMESFSYNTFLKTVQNRKTTLERSMTLSWSNISSTSSDISEKYIEATKDKTELLEDEKVAFLSDCADSVMEMISKTGSTGAFVILDDGEDMKYNYSTIYLKSDNYLSQASTYNNLMLAKGSTEISKKYGYSLVSSWSYALDLTEENYDMLKKPMEAASLTKNLDYLGYWAVSNDVTNENLQVLTYTVPILDEFEEPIGVVGIEISQDYLYKFLPSDEFGDDGSFGYVLATVDIHNPQGFTPIMSNGSTQNDLFSLNSEVHLESLNLEKHMLEEQPKLLQTPKNDICVHYEPLTIYANNTPFLEFPIWIVGMVDLNVMTSFTEEFWESMTTMLVVSLLAGLVFSYIIGRKVAAPIIKLSNAVSTNDVRREINLNKTNIAELDDLADVIKQLQQENIIRTATKTDKILELLNMGVGSFEYIKGTAIVTVSQAIHKMLGINDEKYSQLISKDLFFNKLDKIKSTPLPELTHTYSVDYEETKETKYYKIKEYEQPDAILGVIEDATKEIEDLLVLNYERNYDVLTGIYNRRAFHQKVEEVFKNEDMKIAGFVMFDLDNLKYVNDTFGHESGDVYIKTAANIISSSLAKYGVVGRMSGDEFYAYLYGFDEKEEILHCLNFLYKRLETEPIEMPNSKEFQIRMSGGIAWYRDDSLNLHELIKFADFAMYKGKQTLKGELREFDNDLYLKESFMISGKEELNRILDNELVNFLFQPIIDVKTGKIHAYEALMRPISDTLDTPDRFLQIASLEGKLWKVEKITFFKTLFLYKKFKKMFNGAMLFINSIPIENLTDREYFELEELYKDCLPYLVVEITEQEQQEDSIINAKLDKLHSLGLKIALDDYGSGYANDVSLLNINPNIVKIDRSLISNVHVDPSRQTIVNKIISFCNQNDICILGEGIETEQELEYLIKAGIELAQGYYISRPIDKPTFDSSLIEEKIAEIQSNL